MDLEPMIAPVVEGAGLELVEVSFGREGGRRVLRVTVDREGGVDLDAIAETSERVSRRLDVEGFDPGPYELEVSSPGVERPLNRREDFARMVGRKVRIRTGEPLEGSRTHTGRLVEAGEATVTVATDVGDRVVPYEDMTSARTVFEWPAEDGRETRSKR